MYNIKQYLFYQRKLFNLQNEVWSSPLKRSREIKTVISKYISSDKLICIDNLDNLDDLEYWVVLVLKIKCLLRANIINLNIIT